MFYEALFYLYLPSWASRWALPPFRAPLMKLLLWTFIFIMIMLGLGLWASSGPFPLLAYLGLYKRGRDPPSPIPNPSRHLRKKEVISPRVTTLGRSRKRSYCHRHHCRTFTHCLHHSCRRHPLPQPHDATVAAATLAPPPPWPLCCRLRCRHRPCATAPAALALLPRRPALPSHLLHLCIILTPPSPLHRLAILFPYVPPILHLLSCHFLSPSPQPISSSRP